MKKEFNQTKIIASGINDDFEKTRLEICTTTFERQRKTIDDLNKKAQFLLTFTTAILATLFFKIDYIKSITQNISNNSLPPFIKWGGCVSLIILAISLLLSLLCILLSIRLRKINDGHPKSMINSFFSPTNLFIKEKNNQELLKKISMYHAVAVDDNKRIIQSKSNWLKITHLSMIIALIALAILLSINTFCNITL